jgi:CheY-like chemotaxis protein
VDVVNGAMMESMALRVLVVDDSATARMVLIRQLAALQCDVLSADNGQQALTIAATQAVDIMLLDCLMPVMDGFACVRALRNEEQASGRAHLPVIGVSGETDPAHVQRCLESGMDGILAKPVPVAELENILALWCDRSFSHAPMDVPDNVHHLASVDLPALFRSTSEEDYARLCVMIDAGDVQHAGQLVHRMKGAALTMHQPAMAQTLKEIEAQYRF